MSVSRRSLPWAMLFTALLGCPAIETGLLQLRVVERDGEALHPVAGARCVVEKLALEGLSDEAGELQFSGAPVGPVTVACSLERDDALFGGVTTLEVPSEVGHAGLASADVELFSIDAPGELKAGPGVRSAQLRWTLPTNSGGSQVLGVQVRTLPEGPTLELEGPATEVTVTELADGARHVFTVAVRTVHGLGPSVRSEEITLLRPPGPPKSVEATAGAYSAVITWEPPDDDGGSLLTAFHVTAAPGGQRRTTDGVGKTLHFTELDPRVTYTFTVSAENAVGEGDASKPSAPIAPTDG